MLEYALKRERAISAGEVLPTPPTLDADDGPAEPQVQG